MRVLVTGGTGLVGNMLARQLVERGDDVRALVRKPSSAEPLLPGVALFRGDVTEPDSLVEAMRGVDWVFHSAGMPEQWVTDESVFDRVNRGGTANVLQAALDAGVRRAIYTSTMDVFEAPRGGTLVETCVSKSPKPTAYERSKQEAEKVADRVRAKGLDVVFVNPAAVYGPSPVNVVLNAFFVKLMKRQVPLIPAGGMAVVYVEGLARAHVAAAEKGRAGERYLVADAYVTNSELARMVAREAGLRRTPPTAPLWFMDVVARASAPFARRFGFAPPIAPGQIGFLKMDNRVDASKAKHELGFQPTAVEEGVRATIASLRAAGVVGA